MIDGATKKVSERVLVYANSSGSRHFPIPENYWPESLLKSGGSLSRLVIYFIYDLLFDSRI